MNLLDKDLRTGIGSEVNGKIERKRRRKSQVRGEERERMDRDANDAERIKRFFFLFWMLKRKTNSFHLN